MLLNHDIGRFYFFYTPYQFKKRLVKILPNGDIQVGFTRMIISLIDFSFCDGEADLFDQPVLDHKDRKVTAPDLRKDRQMALCRELLKPKYSVYGFKTVDLKLALNEFFSRF